MPDLRGRPAEEGEPRGEDRREEYLRGLPDADPCVPRFSHIDPAHPAGGPGDGTGHEGDPPAAPLPARRRHGLPEPGAVVGEPLRGRGAADPARHPDRLGAGRRPVRPRRADRRPPPAGQRPPHRDPEAAPRHGQHRPGRGARPGHDDGIGPDHRHGSRGGGGRGRGRLPGDAGGDLCKRRFPDGRLSLRPEVHLPASKSVGPRRNGGSFWRGRTSTTSRRSISGSPSGSSPR